MYISLLWLIRYYIALEELQSRKYIHSYLYMIDCFTASFLSVGRMRIDINLNWFFEYCNRLFERSKMWSCMCAYQSHSVRDAWQLPLQIQNSKTLINLCWCSIRSCRFVWWGNMKSWWCSQFFWWSLMLWCTFRSWLVCSIHQFKTKYKMTQNKIQVKTTPCWIIPTGYL